MRRSTVIGLVIVAGVAVVGLRALASRDNTTKPTTPTSIAAPSTATGTRPTITDGHGVPHGWARDADGAVKAAVSAVQLTGRIARAGFITRSDMIASLASDGYGPTLASESANQLAEMASTLGEASVAPGDLMWRELPLTARVVQASDGDAQVEVWSVLVVGVINLGAPRQAWRTLNVDLVWESDDWKINGWTTRPGPTPLLDATTAIATTEEVNEVVSWPAAGGG